MEKKKPIYLYVLVSLSVLMALFGLWGRLTSSSGQISDAVNQYPESMRAQMTDYLTRASEISSNFLTQFFFYGGLVILTAVIFFLIRKDLLKANISYIVLRLFVLVSAAYSYVVNRNLITSTLTNPELRSLLLNSFVVGVLIQVAVGLIFLAIVIYNLVKQQKVLDKESPAVEGDIS